MLTKLPRAEFIPGTPEQAHRPEQTVCTPEDGPPGGGAAPGFGGSWVTVCDTVPVPMGYCTLEMIQYGQCSVLGPIYGSVQVCRSEWVPD